MDCKLNKRTFKMVQPFLDHDPMVDDLVVRLEGLYDDIMVLMVDDFWSSDNPELRRLEGMYKALDKTLRVYIRKYARKFVRTRVCRGSRPAF